LHQIIINAQHQIIINTQKKSCCYTNLKHCTNAIKYCIKFVECIYQGLRDLLREDLHFLRTEGLNNNRLSIKLIDGKYVLQNDNDFSIHSLKDNERGTLPLLFSILKPYEQFPAVSALLTNLIQVHKLNDAEVKQLSWGIGKSAQSLKAVQIQRIIDILGCIHKQVAVEFNYYKVTEGAVENSDENIVYRQIYPFQVRTFDDRYYLVGIQVGREIKAENIQHFPIDRIQLHVYNTPDLQNVFRKFGEFSWE
jgi:hypothetical protein